MKKFGIDISKWQKDIDFDKLKSEGVQFVILRGVYSKSKDICFDEFYKKCKSRNIPVGAYHYSMAKTINQAKEEASVMLDALKGKKLEYPIWLDVEDKTQQSLGKDMLTNIIKTYCEILENSGYYVGIYSTYYYLNRFTNITELSKKYDMWIAQWSSKNTCPIDYTMWQFGGEINKLRNVKVADVRCDQDYVYKNYPQLMINKGLNGFKKTEVTKRKSIEELAKEVIAGKWGDGAERKNKLTKAGYDYSKVQEKVNKLMRVK